MSDVVMPGGQSVPDMRDSVWKLRKKRADRRSGPFRAVKEVWQEAWGEPAGASALGSSLDFGFDH